MGIFFTILKHVNIESDPKLASWDHKRVHIGPYAEWVIIRYLNMGI